jgi:hypothetical protein
VRRDPPEDFGPRRDAGRGGQIEGKIIEAEATLVRLLIVTVVTVLLEKRLEVTPRRGVRVASKSSRGGKNR